jgi:uncharacterized protein YggU (UPF0235/DUF167 family)
VRGEALVAAHPRGSTLALTVVPRSSLTVLEQTTDGTLRLRVAAPPVDGAANGAVLRYLARALAIPRSRLTIVAGERGRRKRILAIGISPEVLARSVEAALAAAR